MMGYQVCVKSRAGTRPQTGVHTKRIDAIREFIVAFEPRMKAGDDAFIRRHWPSMRKNHSAIVLTVKSK